MRVNEGSAFLFLFQIVSHAERAGHIFFIGPYTFAAAVDGGVKANNVFIQGLHASAPTEKSATPTAFFPLSLSIIIVIAKTRALTTMTSNFGVGKRRRRNAFSLIVLPLRASLTILVKKYLSMLGPSSCGKRKKNGRRLSLSFCVIATTTAIKDVLGVSFHENKRQKSRGPPLSGSAPPKPIGPHPSGCKEKGEAARPAPYKSPDPGQSSEALTLRLANCLQVKKSLFCEKKVSQSVSFRFLLFRVLSNWLPPPPIIRRPW